MDFGQVFRSVGFTVCQQEQNGGSGQNLLLVKGGGQQPLAQVRFGQHHDAPRLGVVAAGRAVGRVDKAGEFFAADGGGGIEVAGGAALVQQTGQVHLGKLLFRVVKVLSIMLHIILKNKILLGLIRTFG